MGIIQARTGSERLPRKMLCKIGNHKIIEWVIKRAKRIKNINKLILSTSNLNDDKVLIEIAKINKINTFIGSENDVLKRFYDTAKFYKKNIIVRLPADNPFIDPNLIDILIKKFDYHKYDYSNNIIDFMKSNYVDGFGAEIFTLDLMKKILNNTANKDYREHVTLYVKDHPSKFKIQKNIAPKELSYPELKFDVDTLYDLKKLRNLVFKKKINLKSSAENIIKSYLSL